MLPFDDVPFALRPQIPNLTGPACAGSSSDTVQRSLAAEPACRGDGSAKGERKRFKSCPIGFFHVDIAEMRCADGKLFLFVAIDRTSKFAYAAACRGDRMIAAQMLGCLIKAVPYRIHTVLTDNGLQFIHKPGTSTCGMHSFDRICVAMASSTG